MTSVSLSSPEGGEGRGEEGRVYWISPLPRPLPTPASWGEGIHRAVSPIPQSPEYMPFPLAHPAAVLPLRRFCPGRLSFLALVIGSVVPDVAYCFGPLDVDVFAHTLPGSLVFCLPMGWLLGMIWGQSEGKS